jgi:hypothetical protein
MWLPGTHRHMCRTDPCFWLEPIQAIVNVETDLL